MPITTTEIYLEDYNCLDKEYAAKEALKEKEKVIEMLRKAKEHKADELTELASPSSSPEGTISSTNDCKI